MKKGIDFIGVGAGFIIFNDLFEKYDPKKRLFPGSVYLDGRIERALKAVVEVCS